MAELRSHWEGRNGSDRQRDRTCELPTRAWFVRKQISTCEKKWKSKHTARKPNKRRINNCKGVILSDILNAGLLDTTQMLPFLEEGQKNSAAVLESFIRGNLEQLKESGGTCVHSTCLLNSLKHLFERYVVFKYFLKG